MFSGKYDVVISGGGPCGSMAAIELASGGLNVLLLEKERLPRYKVCGGGLVYKARQLLPVDISGIAEKEFNRVDINLASDNMSFSVQRDFPVITMIMRDALDHLLLEKASEAGAHIYDGYCLTAVETGDQLKIHANGSIFTAGYLIAADGALSRTAKLCGWKETRKIIPAVESEVYVDDGLYEKLSEKVRFDIGLIPYGYGWMFPKKNHLSIGIASSKKKNINLTEYYEKYLVFLGIKKIISQQKHGFVIPVSCRTDGFIKNNVLLAGDAAGFADPVTAEGITHALLSGKLAAESIMQGGHDHRKVADTYQQLLSQQILQQLKINTYLGKLFYHFGPLRKKAFQLKGQRICETFTDIFLGEKKYPDDAIRLIRKKLRSWGRRMTLPPAL